jgi:nicotinate-nucleotide pyrophosphorylase (carboxylating)
MWRNPTAVDSARKRIHHLVKIEVEVTDMAELTEALSAGADVIMLDNMTPDQIEKQLRKSIQRRWWKFPEV